MTETRRNRNGLDQSLAMVAEFEANIGHQRTREGMALAKKNGKLKGKQPKLPAPARRSIHRIIHGQETPS